MTLTTICVHLDHTERCEARTRLAARIARRHGSHLMGIVPTGLPAGWHPAPPACMEETADVLVEASLHLRRRAETVAHVFHSRLAGPVPLPCDVRLVNGEPAQAVVHLGRASDLIVVGQADAAAAVGDAERRLPEEVMLEAGRPVLIVPRTGRSAGELDRILVAWDESREASLSLRGAIPLLRKAAHVTLVSFLREGDTEAAQAPAPALMSHWLLRHGIRANVERLVTSLRIADALLDRTQTLHSELLVMGGYGHARMSEHLLGGVTRGVLAQAEVPVLMAH